MKKQNITIYKSKRSNVEETYLFLSTNEIFEEIDIDSFKLRKISSYLNSQEVPDFSLALVLTLELLDGDLRPYWWIDLLWLDICVFCHIQ